MRLSTLSITIALTLSSAGTAAAGDVVIDLGRGPVTVHVPSSYAPAAPMPLVMMLHGYTASGSLQESYFQFLPHAEAYGFLYLYPDGSTATNGQRFWNATNACCDFGGSGIDDSSYLRSLVDEVKSLFNVDPRRVHLIGHSNGGFMSYRLACDHADVFASIVSLAGATFADPLDCVPSEPVHTLQIHGTDDGTVLYNGGQFFGQQYPGAQDSVDTWAGIAGCDPQGVQGTSLNLDSGIAGAETVVMSWEDGCADSGSSELWPIVGGGHAPLLSNLFQGLVLDWLFEHPKPGFGINYCTSTPTSLGEASTIRAEGSPSIAANDLELVATQVDAGQFGLFYYGPAAIELPFGNGTRCVGSGGASVFRLPITTADPGNELRTSVDYDAPPDLAGQISSGDTWYFQGWFRDPEAGGSLFDLSDGLRIEFTP